LLLLAGIADAQAPQNLLAPQQAQPQAQTQAQTQPQSQPPTQPDVAPTPPANRPGFIDAFGHWIESSVSDWNSGLKGAADAAKGAADVAKGAADAATTATRDTAGAMVRLPVSRVISERATCPTAPNGAPDCRAAAEAICRAHGFASGGSVDFQTAENCPPVALNRSKDDPPPCVIESYVTRSLCQ
jgi:hypothetical protein